MPSVVVGVSHTDNVALETTNTRSSTVWRIEPTLRYERIGQSTEIRANYGLQVLYYPDFSDTRTFDQFAGSAIFKEWGDRLLVEIGADRRQLQTTTNAALPSGNLPISANRQDRDEFFVAPTLQLDLGRSTRMIANLRNSWVDFGGSDDFSDLSELEPFIGAAAAGRGNGSEQRQADISIDNISAQVGLTYALRYSWQRADYDGGRGVFEYQNATLELGYYLTPASRLFGSFGLESAWDRPLDPALEDERWEVGVSLGSTDRFRFELAAGERTFGTSGRANLQWTYRLGSMQLSYRETPVSENEDVFSNPIFSSGLQADNLLARPDQPERFVSKRLEWTTLFQSPKTTAGITVFLGERTDRRTLFGVPLSDDDSRGIKVDLERRLGARTSLKLFVSAGNRELREGGSSDLLNSNLTIGYRLGARTTLSMAYDYNDEDSDSANLDVRDYIENRVSLSLRRDFF